MFNNTYVQQHTHIQHYQVCADFEYLAPAFGLSVLCVYGGAPWGGQEGALRRGVDIVVGTPGRVKDFMERGTLKLGQVKYVVCVFAGRGGWSGSSMSCYLASLFSVQYPFVSSLL